jgi:hypothetical protein
LPGIEDGATFGDVVAVRKPVELPLTPELTKLAETLARLPEVDRELVIEAARGTVSARTIPWAEFRKLQGTVHAGGGNALEDCDALYDE